MEKVRKSRFSGSWYPDSAHDVAMQIAKWEGALGPAGHGSASGIVPHAGWFFSGKLAYDVIRRLKRDADVLVIVGGHLPSSYPFLHWTCDICETPAGNLSIHRDLRDLLCGALDSEPEDSPDNTIEVQLPIVRSVLGDIPVVAFRAPAGERALDLATSLTDICETKGWSAAVIGSTDLTHYGPNYGFQPAESLDNPREWVRESDGRILDAMIRMDSLGILNEAALNSSACSAGAAACSCEFGIRMGVEKGSLLSYDTSLSKHDADSFVGYGAVVYGS